MAEEHLSAGGVIYRFCGDDIEVILCGRLSPKLWVLPKGTPESNETIEETGLEIILETFIDVVEYWFVSPENGSLCHKRVNFYLMEAVSGDTSLHDHEFDIIEWFVAPLALRAMTYQNEVRVVEKSIATVKARERK
jgi:8-oxo-dGTP pyrophosphatase MutT (NUDIX family)